MEYRACHRLFGSRKCTLRHASWAVRPKDCNAGRESRYRLVGELPTPMNEARVDACYRLLDRHVAVSLSQCGCPEAPTTNQNCKNAAETGANLLHRVMSAYGTKRT
jgi:hypothetical protein